MKGYAREQQQPAPAARDAPRFAYDEAVSRNIGWISEWEQQKLRNSKVAIAGMGGVGGVHMLTLARLGFGRFAIADFDRFELANFNRQMGASLRTLGQPKAASVAMLAREINPELAIDSFDSGLDDSNLEAFLQNVDVYIDGLDFFVLEIRRKLFALARHKGIPAITAAPIGMGTGYLVFTPDGMSFEDYFGFGDDAQENYVRFLVGLTPAMMQRSYLIDPSRVDFQGKRGPSTAIACQLCAGVAATEALKLVLDRGPVKPAPWYHHFDPYRGRLVSRRLRWGVDGPVIGVKRRAVQALIGHYAARARPPEETLPADAPLAQRMIDAARWAPSPDNVQPWRFAMLSDYRVSLRIDGEPGNPYQYRGSAPNWISAGMALEAMRLAASEEGHRLTWTRTDNRLAVEAHADRSVGADPLGAFIRVRETSRARFATRPLAIREQALLAQALGPGFDIVWLTGLRERLTYASLSAQTTALRLRSPACQQVHARVIDVDTRFSRTGLPLRALGLNPLSRGLLAMGLKDQCLMTLMNKVLRADLLGGAEMDWLTGLCSAGYALLVPTLPLPQGADGQLLVGMRCFRFWLEATRLGLAVQPALGPLFASAIAREEAADFDADPSAVHVARRIDGELVRLAGAALPQFAFRLGWPKQKVGSARSIRRPLAAIVVKNDS